MMIWSNGEDLLNKPLSLTAHPFNTNNQQLNSRDYIPERTAQLTWLVAASLPLLPIFKTFWNPIYRFGHVYKNAMPGSGDLTFDALH
jgi:hypothetical protein